MTDPLAMIKDLEAEQRRLVLPSFGHDAAWGLGHILTTMAADLGAAVTVDVRSHTQILFHHARAGTTADNDRWVERKSRTVFHFEEPSWLVRHRFLARGADFGRDSGLDPLLYAAHGGSYPVMVPGAGVVAAVTVSGLPQDEDHRLVVAGLTAHLAAV